MTLDHVMHRIRECGDCWEWIHSATKDHGRRYPQARIDGKWQNVRRYFYRAVKDLKDSLSVVPCCGNPYCINPEHCKAMTERQKCRQVAAKGGFSSPARARKIAMARRAGLSKINEEIAAAIRLSEEPGPRLAEKYGIDNSLVARIRRGDAWKDYSNPFSGLGGG